MNIKEEEQAILDIEIQAAAIHPSDKETLYDLLVVAYYKARDIIVTLKASQPAIVKVIDTDLVDELTFKLKQSKKSLQKSKELHAIEETCKVVEQQKLQDITTIINR